MDDKPTFIVQELSCDISNEDDKYLTRTGKVPVLKRTFGFIPILGFNLLVLATWLSAFTIFAIGFPNGGPAGLIWGFIIVWAGNFAVFASLAELASIAPTAGGQYHWVSLLASKSTQKVLSYVTGWLTVCGWLANVASSSFICGQLMIALIEVIDPNYVFHLWHNTLLSYAALLIAVLGTVVAGRYLPMLESALLVIYILGFFGVLVPLVYFGPHASAKDVFTQFVNRGGWPTQGLSFMIGISGNAYAFLGADSCYHMSEEIRNAAVIVPRSMMLSTFINGVVGLAMYVAVLFGPYSIDTILDSPYVYPSLSIVMNAFNSRAGTAIVVAICLTVNLGLIIGVVAAASRMLWSFARDRGVPGWRWIQKVDSRSSIPVNAIIVTIATSLLLDLITVGSAVAFNDVISLTVTALYASYLSGCAMLLWRRWRKTIKAPEELSNIDTAVNMPGSEGSLVWGPWRVREPFGTIVNILACLYLIVIGFFCLWPPGTPVTPNTMNYSIVVFGFVAIVSALYYWLQAQKTYKGPVVERPIS